MKENHHFEKFSTHLVLRVKCYFERVNTHLVFRGNRYFEKSALVKVHFEVTYLEL